MKCCICGKEIIGWGNNPRGALVEGLRIGHYAIEDRCCDDCNKREVIPGRIVACRAKEVLRNLGSDTDENRSAKLKELLAAGRISKAMYEFIIVNLDKLFY